MEEEIEEALLEAVWIMRNGPGSSLVSVLEVKEAEQMCVDIVKELKKAGYIIKKV